jgi:uncharacterized protein (TIGR02118 family)
MHVLTVCYGHPADPAAFDAYYTSTHVPLAEKIPGLASFTYRHCDSLDGSQPPYHLLAELSFASREALDVGLASPGGTRGRRGRRELRRRRGDDVRGPRLSRAQPGPVFVCSFGCTRPGQNGARDEPGYRAR